MDIKEILIKKAQGIPTPIINRSIIRGYKNYIGKQYPMATIKDMYKLYPYDWFTYIVEQNKVSDFSTNPEDDETLITVLAYCSNSYRDIRYAADVYTRCFELAGLVGVKTNPIADRYTDISMFIPTQSDIIYSIFDKNDNT